MASEPGTPAVPPPPPPPAVTPDERTWATMAHVSGIIASFVTLSALGPLIVWLVKKNESSFVDDHGREALNFQITVMCVAIVIVILGFATCGIGLLLLPLLGIASIVLSIFGAVKANDGLPWRYPVSIRFIGPPPSRG